MNQKTEIIRRELSYSTVKSATLCHYARSRSCLYVNDNDPAVKERLMTMRDNNKRIKIISKWKGDRINSMIRYLMKGETPYGL